MKIIFIPFNKKVIIYLLIAIVILVFLFILLSHRSSIRGVFNLISPQAIYKGDEGIEKLAFACNVVWGTEHVPQMLDIFENAEIKITFFIGGEWAKDNPELLKEMSNRGHELGNHGYYHKHHNQLSLDQNRQEISQTEDVLREITGIKTRLFAPPYGEFNDTTLEAAESLGYKTIMWSIDTIDWRREGAQVISNRVLKKPHNGAIVLMHPVEDTVEALPVIIEELRDRGFEIGTVSDILP